MSENWWSESLAYSARTDVGMRRSNNQDSYYVLPASSPRLWTSRGHLFIVADGMGVHAAGERASQLATTTVSQSYLKRTDQRPYAALRDSILDAHDTIKRQGRSDEAFHDMGTTCDALILLPQRAYIGHVGDSRVYRLRNHVIEQMTFDHSLVWEVKYGAGSQRTAREPINVPKNIITRSLGPTDNLEVALEGPFETKPGDAFLMCSDGLSGQVDDREIGQILSIFQPEEATESLVNLANLRGGPDNITVVVARVQSNPSVEEAEVEKAEKVYEKRPPLNGLAMTAAVVATVFILAFLGSFFISKPSVSETGAPQEGGIQWGLTLGALALAALSTGAFLFLGRKTLFSKPAEVTPATEALGKGPYTRASAAPSKEFHKKIALVCDELCEVLRKDSVFTPDWQGISKALDQAKKCAEQKNYGAAIRANFSVINYIMRELRNYARQKKSAGAP